MSVLCMSVTNLLYFTQVNVSTAAVNGEINLQKFNIFIEQNINFLAKPQQLFPTPDISE